MCEGLGGTYLGREVEVLLVAFSLLLFSIVALTIQSDAWRIVAALVRVLRQVGERGGRTEMGWNLLSRDGGEDLRDLGLADVHEHVRVGESLHRSLGRRLGRRVDSAVDEALSSVVVLEHLAIRDGDDTVVVEAQPSAIGRGLDVDEIVATVDVSRMDEDAVELVVVALASVGFVVQVLSQVDLQRVLISVVDLRITL